ncbi:MAG: glutamine--tRNA ligase/YqeY domain fusion protein [Candidatus Magnetomorum sp.]|nr:glutamine--tRNA ligase/YqeY domain fusion protein [Candidatus Magnetomorum sp.]
MSPSKDKPTTPLATDEKTEAPSNFIKTIIANDLEANKNNGRVATRFPPEPNGYLHIGHAKSICLNFGLAKTFNGTCNLRLDDTNPGKENEEYVHSIQEDVRWLGFDWEDRKFFASDYFDKIYAYAEALVRAGKAYVCSLSPEKIREYRGTLTEPGKDSPYRNRTIEENLNLLEGMRAGEYEEGAHVLRAKIDMAAPNIVMRDPTLFRIKKEHHHRTGNKWLIYPMYDFAHCLSDATEGITHSICTLEFENNRELYDWILDQLDVPCHPQQIEFARLNLTYTVLSKRKLIQLVEEGHVSGWDDPRMPSISGLRRRGYTPESIRQFCERIGVARRDSVVDIALLEYCIREHLNKVAPRYLAVIRPLKLVIINYPEDEMEQMEAINNPEDPSMGSRLLPFSRELFIEQDDFCEDPPKKYFRLAPGKEVRLRYAYYVTCVDVIKDPDTQAIQEIHCTYDPETRGGSSPDGRKVKGTIHWVSCQHAVDAEVRLYEHLFTSERPGDTPECENFIDCINPESCETLPQAKLEPSLKQLTAGDHCQFERLGYFCVDTKESTPDHLVINRTVTLRDTWSKIMKKGAK